MSRVVVACALAALIPAAARAEPISVTTSSLSGGVTQSGAISIIGTSIDLGQLFMPGADVGTFFFSAPAASRNYSVSFDLTGISGASGFRVELLDPLGDGDDRRDPNAQPAWMPAGYSTSNDHDGLSFAQGSGLARSATFAGGSAIVEADEITHRGDILMFSGLNGIERARVEFGLRNARAARGFLLRICTLTAPAAHAPEPASMVLLGTGLAGLVAARRRRRSAAARQLAI